ncbi:HGGxSTG domain-containing protein [Altererythrobacter sp. GH1-8]|uniref:HGGxSTG domain-containing protein n=1 Tax=Altererythrobacter sp. GH1-8 TaxID=3349333 RepID=UPI00374D7A54
MQNSIADRARICGARNRKGVPCRRKAMANGRCHFHGGKSPGAPVGNLNALKHGRYIQTSA